MNAKLKKPLLVAGVTSSLLMAGVTGSGFVSAATSSGSSSTDPMSSLIDKLATKFNLDKEEVKTVFEEERSAHEADRQQRLEDRLDQAVTDGKITSEQKEKIIAKLKELKATMEANRDSLKDKSAAERKAAMESQRTELKAWATENNIPTEYLRQLVPGGPGGHGGPRDVDSSNDQSSN